MTAGSGAKRRARLTLWLAAGFFVLLLALMGGGWLWLRASLPALDGELAAGVARPVQLQRDTRGVVTIEARDRLDAAYATGFAHGQDRFFQMDLARRFAAGELAALIGEPVLEFDRQRRRHQMRTRAGQALQRFKPADLELLRRYAEGVNAGLASLGARPFEYLLLRQQPEPWRPADSALVLAGMYFQLQASLARQERELGLLHQCFAGPVYEFLAPVGTEWDTPLTGGSWPQTPIPAADLLNIRTLLPLAKIRYPRAGEPASGSNNWAVSGARSATGAAWLANDMHLGYSVPPIWYRLHLRYFAGGRRVEIGGLSLPGMPFVVAGSNGQVAWSYTNSYGDWLDLIPLELVPGDPSRYRVPGGSEAFRVEQEVIEVAGTEPVTIDVRHSRWGPVIEDNYLGRPLAWRWIAHSDQWLLSNGLLSLETAASVDEVLDIAPGVAIPAQNLLVADAAGNIGWTIMGRIPLRRDSRRARRPLDWHEALPAWPGWLPEEDYPRIANPAEGFLATANQRQADGQWLERIGYGKPRLGARARQITRRLQALKQPVTATDMHAIQLDHEARFLARWRELLVGELAGEDRQRGILRELVAADSRFADADAAGYRLLREYRDRVIAAVMQSITRQCEVLPDDFDGTRQAEGPVWRILEHRPMHLLDAAYADWHEFLLAEADRLIEDAVQAAGHLENYRWGDRNRLAMTHPLADAIPLLGGFLNMPPVALTGDQFLPKVQTDDFGQSERMAVSPGHEADAYLSMPGGQSGHPLSPFYRSLHADWIQGLPTPFLPGPAEYELVLRPVDESPD